MPRKPEEYSTHVPKNEWGGKRNDSQDIVQWLVAHPDFDDRPATIIEFLGPNYLDIDATQNSELEYEGSIRPGVKRALIDIFGEKIDPSVISLKREALFTGGIGIGKTTMASVALAYMVHWVCCLHDPQKYFRLLPGSRIAFMLMSTKDSQAKEVLFGDIKARINHAKWFKKNCNYDPNYKNQLRFPKNIWVIPGNSAETTFEGYNILGGIMDEGDSHKVTEEKDYAAEGYRTIRNRITSRFTDPITQTHRGLLITIGQTKSAQGFMSRKKADLEKENKLAREERRREPATVVHMALWESYGWDYYRNPSTGKVDSFFFDVQRRQIIPEPVGKSMGRLKVGETNIIEIPMAFFKDFNLDPVQALKDHAGIPPHVDDPFIVLPDRVYLAQTKWKERFPGFQPVGHMAEVVEFNEALRADNFSTAAIKRAIHVDIGYASHGDAAGLAMAHIPELVDIDGELKPVIVFDFLLRMKPGSGNAIMLRDFRKIIRQMRDERGFKIGIVTYDGFQSVESLQLLREARFNADELSIDRTKGPYEDLREAIYEQRIEFPEYVTYLRKGETDRVNIAARELLELQDNGKKIDHPPKGSKDLADAMAGCVHALMRGNFRRGAKRPEQEGAEQFDPVLDMHMIGETLDLTESGFVQEVVPLDSGRPQFAGPGMPSPGFGLPSLERDPFGALRRYR